MNVSQVYGATFAEKKSGSASLIKDSSRSFLPKAQQLDWQHSRPLRKLWLSHFIPSENNIEHALHAAQQLLVWSCGSALKVSNDGGCRVALCCEILLCHGRSLIVLGFGAGLGDGLADCGAYGLWLDDVVGAVDFGEALAFL